MASYKIIFKPSTQKDLAALPQSVAARVFKRIEALKDDPFPRQSIKLAGTEQLYRIRIGHYRVIYGINKNAKEVVIHYVRHRRDAYRRI